MSKQIIEREYKLSHRMSVSQGCFQQMAYREGNKTARSQSNRNLPLNTHQSFKVELKSPN